MIKIFSVFPDRLNLNGDAANAMVLTKQLDWAGKPHELVILDSVESINLAAAEIAAGSCKAVVIFGHGSKAALQSLASTRSSLFALAKLCREKSAVGIAVGSALKLVSSDELVLVDRLSEFVVADQSDPEWPSRALGYVNTNLAVPPLKVDGWLIETTLHGPMLSKNSLWVSEIFNKLGVDVSLQKEDLLKAYEAKIWQLEAEH